jgi:hypothetical protein
VLATCGAVPPREKNIAAAIKIPATMIPVPVLIFSVFMFKVYHRNTFLKKRSKNGILRALQKR